MIRQKPADRKAARIRIGLSGRFALLAFALLAGVAGLAYWAVNDFSERQSAHFTARLAQERADSVAALAAEILSADPLGAERAGQQAAARFPDGAGMIASPGGEILAAWGSSQALLDGANAQAPILFGDLVLGEVRLAQQYEGASGFSNAESQRIVAQMAAVLALAMALIGLLVRHVTGPIRRLTQFAEQLSPQTLASRIMIRTGDELETLADSVNDMVGRLGESMRRVQQLAFIDAVTGLPNQERLRHDIDAAIDRRREDGGNCGLAIISFDRLARTVETLGRTGGDELIMALAQRLNDAVSSADANVRILESREHPAVLAKISDSEFAVLLPILGEESDFERFVQLIVAPFGRPFEHRETRVTLGCNVGAACLPRDAAEADLGLRHCRMALTAARNASQPMRFFTPSLDRAAIERLTLEREMRVAIEANQFRAHFQPKVCLRTGRIIGAEALARWNRPDGISVGPVRFIPLAEEAGMIGPIAEAVLRDACWKAAGWLREGLDMSVAVNVSAIQLGDDRFPALVRRLLEQSGLRPESLELEITESVAMDDPERAMRMVGPLRELGVRFAIDDFGTGHSSLAALTRLPFDVLKIDQSFVRCLSTDKQSVSIIETILALAVSLNFESVAEGVETELEAEFLRRRGCPVAQGYHYGKPMPPLEFLATLRAAEERRAQRIAL